MNFKEWISMNYENKIRCICSKDYKYFLSKPNVVAIGFGNKIKGGFLTSKKCIKVFVKKKLSENSLAFNELIPEKYKDIETDIVESGIIKMQSLNKKVRPVPGGYNIGIITLDTNGTLGCLVSDGKEIYLLSNNHVLTFYNTVDIATPIVQPSTSIGGKKSKNIVATLSKYVPLKESTIYRECINYVDCALGRVPNRSFVSTDIAFIGNIQGVKVPNIGDKVKKVGCNTELTTGIISDLCVTAKIIGANNELYIYKDQIFTNKMSEGGDSGAILINKDTKGVGFLMGGGESVSVYNCLHCVLKALNVRIVTKL